MDTFLNSSFLKENNTVLKWPLQSRTYLGETNLRIGHWCKASEVKNFNQVAVSNRINFVMNSGYKFIILYEFLMFNLWKISTIACNFNADMKVIAKVKTIYLKIARNIGPS